MRSPRVLSFSYVNTVLLITLRTISVNPHYCGLPGGAGGKEPTYQCKRCKRHRFDTWVGKIPWRRAWQPTPVFLPGESYGQRNLVDYSPYDCTELDVTEVT